MNRITWLELEGKRYPLNLSMKATRLIAERFGGMENVETAMSGQTQDQVIETLSWLLAVLMQQGFAYCDLTGTERPEKLLSQDDLEVLLQPADIPDIQTAAFGAMTLGAAREVQVEEPKKNVEAAQG